MSFLFSVISSGGTDCCGKVRRGEYPLGDGIRNNVPGDKSGIKLFSGTMGEDEGEIDTLELRAGSARTDLSSQRGGTATDSTGLMVELPPEAAEAGGEAMLDPPTVLSTSFFLPWPLRDFPLVFPDLLSLICFEWLPLPRPGDMTDVDGTSAVAV